MKGRAAGGDPQQHDVQCSVARAFREMHLAISVLPGGEVAGCGGPPDVRGRRPRSASRSVVVDATLAAVDACRHRAAHFVVGASATRLNEVVRHHPLLQRRCNMRLARGFARPFWPRTALNIVAMMRMVGLEELSAAM